jgi:16S rRNA (guanine(966)-N(2))-methyltransferase RsmD
MAKQNRKSGSRTSGQQRNKDDISSAEMMGLRIIGGKFRGRKLLYSGQHRTRPMKDRLREAVFNLIGRDIAGTHAIDLFAGTGALGLEALSRGAARATLIEQHYPTADIIRQNILALEVESQTEIVPGNVFIWAKRHPDLGTAGWLVFCSPPYEFYASRTGEMLELLGGLIHSAPEKSIFLVEADDRFNFDLLPNPKAWDIRSYPPAVIGVHRK